MGYRNYIGYIPKKEYNKIKSLTTSEFNIHNNEIENGYVSVSDFTIKLHDLGKDCNIQYPKNSYNKKFFKNKELNYVYNNEDTDLFIIKKEFFENIIEYYRIKISTYYDEMILPFANSELLKNVSIEYDSDNKYHFDFSLITNKEQTALYKIINHVRSFRPEWDRHKPYDLNDGLEEITSSWKFEYAIFELVRIYKNFDWKKNIMVYYGH